MDWMLSYRYSYPLSVKEGEMSRSDYVVAGLPVRHSFSSVPQLEETIELTPVLVSNFGSGKERVRSPYKARVIGISPIVHPKVSGTLTLELTYES